MHVHNLVLIQLIALPDAKHFQQGSGRVAAACHQVPSIFDQEAIRYVGQAHYRSNGKLITIGPR